MKPLPATRTVMADRKKYNGLGVLELWRLHQPEEDNQQVKQLVADLSIDKQMFREVIQKLSG